MKNKISIIFTILTLTLLFTSSLMSMSMPKRIGIGVAFNSPEIVIPIWISDKFVVEPEFRFWKQKSLQSNSFDLVEYRRIIKFGIGFFRRFSREELSFCAGIRTDVSQDLTIEDYSGGFYEDEELTRTLVNYGISPVVGAEYFFHERFSLGGEIQVNLNLTNIKTDYYDLEESSNSIDTNTEIYIRFYLK